MVSCQLAGHCAASCVDARRLCNRADNGSVRSIDSMCRCFLPSFDFNAFQMQNCHASYENEPQGGSKVMERLRQRLMLLKMTVDAKLETVAVLRLLLFSIRIFWKY